MDVGPINRMYPNVQYIFTTDGGEIGLIFPKNMTPQDLSEFEEYMKLVMRSLKRRADRNAPPAVGLPADATSTGVKA